MKTSEISSGISVMLLFILVLLPHEHILAQDQNALPAKQKDIGSFSLPIHHLTLPLFDTVRPTLSTCGKGLPYYDCIILNYQDKTYLFNFREEETPILKQAKFTEVELEVLNQNLLFINKQSQVQIREWIRKEKWDLNLGEMIKGFYITPIF